MDADALSLQPGHEYTKSNVKFALSVLKSEPVKALETFAQQNKETQGKFTIGDEKVRRPHISFYGGTGCYLRADCA